MPDSQPELERVVRTCGGEGRAVGRERYAVHIASVSGEGADFGAGGDVPELEGVVSTCRGQGRAVGRERYTPHSVSVSGEGADFGAGGDVPELRVLSQLAEARVVPSGDNATPNT